MRQCIEYIATAAATALGEGEDLRAAITRVRPALDQALGLHSVDHVVLVRWRHGSYVSYVNALPAVVFALSTIYCGVVSSLFLDLGSMCQDPHCWYELGQVVWWFLSLIHWLALVVLVAIAFYVKVLRRPQKVRDSDA